MNALSKVSLCAVICGFIILGFPVTSKALTGGEITASILSGAGSNWPARILGTASVSNVLPSEQVFEKVKKSTVRVVTLYEGTVTMPSPIYNKAKDIFVPGEVTTEKYVGTYILGTGFAISPDGYIATCAHVVDEALSTAEENLWYQFQDNLYYDLADEFPDESEAGLEKIYNKALDYVSEYSEISDVTYDISVLNPANYDKDFDEQFDEGYKAEVRKFGSPYPQYGKDLAIIKIEKNDMTPAIISNSDDVKPGNKVYVVGYPAIADLSDKTVNIPSFTAGVVSAIKPSDLGNYDVIQIDAAVTGGNSGGPVANEKGEIIGVATFKAEESDSYNWILPINLLKDYINELNVKTVAPEPEKVGILAFLLNPLILGLIVLSIIVIILATLLIILFLKNRNKPVQLSSVPQIPQVPQNKI